MTTYLPQPKVKLFPLYVHVTLPKDCPKLKYVEGEGHLHTHEEGAKLVRRDYGTDLRTLPTHSPPPHQRVQTRAHQPRHEDADLGEGYHFIDLIPCPLPLTTLRPWMRVLRNE